jgi:hypothetical protein
VFDRRREEEKVEPVTPLPALEGDLFAETSGDEPIEPLESAKADVAGEPAPPPTIAPPLPPPVPAVDKSHWRSLLNELGFEAPPEPDAETVAPAAQSSPSREPVDAGPERFRGARDEIVDAEVVAEPRAKRNQPRPAPAAPSHPFGAGLFSDAEESRFVRAAPEPAAEETPAAAGIEEEPESPEPATIAAEEERAPRKRGRRRTRAWTRLHSQTEEPEAEESAIAETAATRESAELAEEVETADDLFGEEEPVETAEAVEPAEEEGDRRRRPRRRRRRTRGGERTGERESRPAASKDMEDVEEAEQIDASDDLLADEDAEEEEVEAREERSTRERRRRRETAEPQSEDDANLGDEFDDELDGERPAHRKIPTWEEAVGLVISVNMESRAKSPGGRRRR